MFLIPSNWLCKCGCGGQHSLASLYDVWLWSFRFAAMGRAHTKRHDLSPFDESDQARNRVGQMLAKRDMCLWIKTDWDALANYFGFPSWASTLVSV